MGKGKGTLIYLRYFHTAGGIRYIRQSDELVVAFTPDYKPTPHLRIHYDQYQFLVFFCPHAD